MYKAMGGGWDLRQGQDLIPEEMKERMKKRSDWWFLWGSKPLETSDLNIPPSEESPAEE